jgi:hypothetical protein
VESMGILWEGDSVSPWADTQVFQAEIYAILACVYEIQLQNRPEKYVFALIVRRR